MSTITLADLLSTAPGPVQTSADAWKALSDDLDKAADEFTRGTRDLGYAWPSGTAATAATAKVDALRQELNAAYNPANRIAQALAHHASAMADLRSQAENVINDATSRGFVVDVAAATVTAPQAAWRSGGTGPYQYPSMETDPERLRQQAQAIVTALGSILAKARGLDDTTVAAINQNLPNPTTGFGSLSNLPPVTRDDVLAQRGRDPKAVNEWWRNLTPAQREQAIHDYPDLVGWLDGVPAVDRDAANRIRLGNDVHRLENEQRQLNDRENYIRSMMAQGRGGELYPNAGNPLRAAEVELDRIAAERRTNEHQLAGLDRLGRKLDTLGADGFLLGVDPTADGKAIVAVGNPDTAQNVLTYVPGTGSELYKMPGDIERANRMAHDANAMDPSRKTATIAWLGYDAPDGIPNAASGSYADGAVNDLSRFQNGLRATHETAAPSHNVVLGHSYGTTVVGHTAMQTDIHADDLVFVASPGVGTNTVHDLQVPADHVWATTAEHDMIRRIPDWDVIHGNEPVRDDFGAHVFSSDPGDPNDEKATHSKYWDQNNIARDNIAKIVTGQGGVS